MIHRLSKTQLIRTDLKSAWEFFSSPKNLSRITPPDLGLKIVSQIPEKMYEGLLIKYKVKPFPLYESQWVTEITHLDEPHFFVDEQRYGPYTFWHHKHYFKEVEEGVEIEDIVDYSLPLGPIGDIINSLFVAKRLEYIFEYRSREIVKIFS